MNLGIVVGGYNLASQAAERVKKFEAGFALGELLDDLKGAYDKYSKDQVKLINECYDTAFPEAKDTPIQDKYTTLLKLQDPTFVEGLNKLLNSNPNVTYTPLRKEDFVGEAIGDLMGGLRVFFYPPKPKKEEKVEE